MVTVGEVRSEDAHRGEVDGSLGEQVENQREPARGSGDLDAVVGLVLAESQAERRDLAGKLAKAQTAADARFEGIALTGKRVVFLVDMSGSMELVDENTRASISARCATSAAVASRSRRARR